MKIVCESSHNSNDFSNSNAINHSDLVKSCKSNHAKSHDLSLVARYF